MLTKKKKDSKREILCCLFPDNAFQIGWNLKTLDVTRIRLVIVLTKQRTTALSPSDKSKAEEYVPGVLFVLIQVVDALVRAKVKMQLHFFLFLFFFKHFFCAAVELYLLIPLGPNRFYVFAHNHRQKGRPNTGYESLRRRSPTASHTLISS